MPAFELKTWFAAGDATWTERFYWVGSSYGAAMQRLQVCTRYRIALLGQGAACTQLRVSDLAVWRDSIVSAPSGQPAASNACLPSSGLLVRLQGVSGQPPHGFYRTLLLRCFPVAWLPPSPGDPAPTVPAALAALAEWQQALRANGLCIQAIAGTGPLYPVTALAWWATGNTDTVGNPLQPKLSDKGSTFVSLALSGPAGQENSLPSIPVGSKVGIHGVSYVGGPTARAPGVNGSREVLDSMPGLISVIAEAPAPGQWVRSGTVQLETEVYVPIRDVVPRGVGEKKVGHQKAPAPLAMAAGPTPRIGPHVVPRRISYPTLTITPVGGPYPGTVLITNARELCELIYEGYPDVLPETTKPLALYQIMNLQKSYYILCSGTDSYTNFVTGIPADIYVGLGLPFGFPNVIYETVLALVPDGSTVYLAGHSLGGMACESFLNYYAGNTNAYPRLVTFGAPVIGFLTSVSDIFKKSVTKWANFGQKAVRFSTLHDPVPALSPIGLVLEVLGNPELTIVSNAPFPEHGPINTHTHYPMLKSLEVYDVLGNDKTAPDYIPLIPFMYLKLIFTVDPGGA
jgi:Lipase (class 3)